MPPALPVSPPRDSANSAELGETATFLALLVAITATALWAVDRLPERRAQPRWLPVALYASSAVVTVVATGWMVQADQREPNWLGPATPAQLA